MNSKLISDRIHELQLINNEREANIQRAHLRQESIERLMSQGVSFIVSQHGYAMFGMLAGAFRE